MLCVRDDLCWAVPSINSSSKYDDWLTVWVVAIKSITNLILSQVPLKYNKKLIFLTWLTRYVIYECLLLQLFAHNRVSSSNASIYWCIGLIATCYLSSVTYHLPPLLLSYYCKDRFDWVARPYRIVNLYDDNVYKLNIFKNFINFS